MPSGTAIFVDTSILISRLLSGPEMKKAIEKRLALYDITVSSPVVVQEFKRRVLNEAVYLMELLNKKGSYKKVNRHVTSVLDSSKRWKRKRKICLEILWTIFEKADDLELTIRAKQYLRTLIKHGTFFLKKELDSVVPGTGCYLSNYPIKEKKPYVRYDLGEIKCSKVHKLCPVVDYLKEKIELCKKILKLLSDLPNKTVELEKASEFLKEFIANPDNTPQMDPCISVGDLLIALESHKIPNFYTKDKKESPFFCNVLEQNLIIRPNNPEHSDKIVKSSQEKIEEKK